MKTNEKGRSMIEMLGVLAIIGVLSVGGIAGYSKAMAKFRANKTIDQISHIVANTRILFGSQKNYGDLGSSDAPAVYLLSTTNILPDEMRTGTKIESTTGIEADGSMIGFMNPYSGGVLIYAAKRSAGDNDRAFIISYFGIPKEACVDLASQDWNSSSGSGLLAFAVNNVEGLEGATYGECESKTSADEGGLTCAIDMPMKVSDAMTACGEDTTNTLSFKFY